MDTNQNFENQQNSTQPEASVNSNAVAPAVKTPIYKKWWFWVIIGVVIIAIIAGSGSGSDNQGSGDASGNSGKNNLGKYNVVIDSCRLATDYAGNPIVIVKYKFTNNSDDPIAFWLAVDENVFQNDIGLNVCYLASDSANYSTDNQMKEIRKGATIEVEVAYTLNDTTTPIEVEVKELISFSDKTITKKFNID